MNKLNKMNISGSLLFHGLYCSPSHFVSQLFKIQINMKENKIIFTRKYESPCGTLMLGSCGDRICLCDWQDGENRESVLNRLRRLLGAEFQEGSSDIIDRAVQQLDEYFKGSRRDFDLPLLFAGTEFQQNVWKELLTIPYGSTISYRELAQRLGNPKAVRAIANAVGANAISILVPCHRVIGADHSLTGYAGGLQAKKHLLELEKDEIK